jgi:hypothetical protein
MNQGCKDLAAGQLLAAAAADQAAAAAIDALTATHSPCIQQYLNNRG